MANYSDIKGFTVQTLSTDTIANQGAGGSWASGGSMNTARDYVGGASADKDSGLIFGGSVYRVEQYDGSSWTEKTEMSCPNAVNYSRSPMGTATACIAAGGSSGYSTLVEQWDGSSWTEIAEINTGRGFGSASPIGTVTAGLVVGGLATPPGGSTVDNEEWNGSSWTEKSNLNTGRSYNAGLGVYTSAMVCAGQAGPPGFTVANNAETWDGTSWTEVAEVNTARARGVAAGSNSTSAIFYSGATGPSTGKAETEFWDGSSWTEVADLATARMRGGGGGTAATALMAAGRHPSPATAATEEWSAPATFTKQVEGQLYFNSTTNTFKETLFVISDGTWASGGSLNDGRSSFTGIGIQTAVVAASGQDSSTSLIDSVEEYNGTVWTEVNDTPVTLKYPGAGGVLTAGWLAGGLATWNGTAFSAETYEYDGTNWTDSGNINTNRYTAYGGGPQTAAFIAGGNNTSFAAVGNTELYNGSAWTETGTNLNTSRANGFGNGTQTDGIFAGGSPGTKDEAETWDGTSWTEVSELNTGRYSIGVGGGTAPGSSVLAAGGAKDPGNVNNVESWNGTSWTERAELAATNSSNGLGISGVASAISFGGFSPTPSTFAVTSEHWTVDLSNKTITAS